MAETAAIAAGAGLAPELQELATRVVAEALRRGATAAECVVRDGRELSVTVRLGEPETIKQAQGKALGIRVFRGHQAGTTYSSDFAWPAVEAMTAAALEIAAHASADPFAGLPEPGELGQCAEPLELYSEAAAQVTPAAAIAWAQRAERAALDCDARLRNSDGASFDAVEGLKVLANSHGFCGAYRSSYCSGSVVPIAMEGEARQRDYWYTVAREPAGMEAPEAVGREAARRALRRLGARKVATMQAPVVFDPQTARSLLDHLAGAVSGEAIYREASFLRGRLGAMVAHPAVTIIDDGARRGGLGSAPFDGEGAPKRRTTVIREGRLESYLLNCYAARRLNLRTTGNAARGLAGTPGVSCGNLWLEPGTASPEAIIGGVKQGLYVTQLIGFGFNPVSGDYSRGACGHWIENGELAYPVEEITVAGNFADMLRQIGAIGNDLEFRTAMAAPTLLIDGLTVAGR